MSPQAPEQLSRLAAAWGKADPPDDHASAYELLICAEEIIAGGKSGSLNRTAWLQYLDVTRQPSFLTALPDGEARRRWAETTFAIISSTSFQLGDLLAQRAAAHPDRILFRDLSPLETGNWSYAQVERRTRNLASVFLGFGDRPRLALFCENSVAGACCDLACLTHGILVAPLNTHLDVESLSWSLERLQINMVVTDHPDRLQTILNVRKKLGRPLTILTLTDLGHTGTQEVLLLPEQEALLKGNDKDTALAGRLRPTMREAATVMFTSGSTGRPKGVVFNQHNLVSKRFARAAALPQVGRDEVLLCYLPLFHTFGRFLEMLGSLFWGGTYVFAGNPAIDTLLDQFQKVRPSGLVSVPVRWVQIRDRVGELTESSGQPDSTGEIFRRLVGDNLRWGLSAAGYLDPKVFRFYHRQGVALCSGFGMTEGTGGLTMTPPDDYVADSVGIPLPGVRTRFSSEGELNIAGPYIARYLPEDDPAGSLKVESPEADDFWLPTGDLFRKVKGEHLEIVDRVKDIYKNNRGQTIAPRKVEALFTNVPGIKRTFLAGDGRSYNTLLIVPDEEDPVLRSLPDQQDRRKYFQQIITTAHPSLATSERVVNFAILDRDFSQDKGELTPKGSYRRKTIEKNFTEVIGQLYRTDVRTVKVGGFEVVAPRWFFRDLGVIEDTLDATDLGLVLRDTDHRLTIIQVDEGRVQIGDLIYQLSGHTIDLGLLSRQPLLWAGNPQLKAFCPCRPGWDTDLAPFAEQVFLPEREPQASLESVTGPAGRQLLDKVHASSLAALFGAETESLAAIASLADQLKEVEPRLANLIRRRLETLANHPEQSVRCRAYQVLVMDQPVADFLHFLPSFIDSGKPFLDETSIAVISKAHLEPRRLQAVRQRLHAYRIQLPWPAPAKRRELFQDLLHLLADFGRCHPEFYGTVREELVCWIMHESDPELARFARQEFEDLSLGFEEKLAGGVTDLDPKVWRGKILYQEGLSPQEVQALSSVLIGTTFLRQSLLLAFEGEELCLEDIPPEGIWVSRIISRFEDSRYRVSVNTHSGKHFDIQLIIRKDADQDLFQDTVFWYIVLRAYPFGTPMLPAFGCCRPDLGALSQAYVSDLTVWEKIREFSSVRGPGTAPPPRMRWHQLLVRALSVVIKGWRNSERRIIPGLITPNNILVPDPDFRKGAIQNNLTGWTAYRGPLSLIRPLWRNIYNHTISHYPWCREYLENHWIFEAFVEALGVDSARIWLDELQAEVAGDPASELWPDFAADLQEFRRKLGSEYQRPLALQCAVHRFDTWRRRNPEAGAEAILAIVEDLARLYRLDSLEPLARFTLFRHTYFEEADPGLLATFETLLQRMFQNGDLPATQLVELSELQAGLSEATDRQAFHRLAFPHHRRGDTVEIQAVGEATRGRTLIRSTISDTFGQSFTVTEPASPADVGRLYRLFLLAGFPRIIDTSDQYFIASEESEQIIGGVIYRPLASDTVFLEGIVVAKALAGRGIPEALLTDFATRMKAVGCKRIQTPYFMSRFFQYQGFRMDHRQGVLSRDL